MSRPAPPGEPGARGRGLEGAWRVLLAAASGAVGAFLWIALASQVLGLLAYLLSRAGQPSTWARGGLLLTVLCFRASAAATIPGLPAPGSPSRPIEATFVFVPMLLTLAFVWLAARAGRRAAERRAGGGAWVTAAIAAAGSGLPVAALAALAAAAARLSIPTLAVELAGDATSAAAWGFGLAAASSAGGAAFRVRERSPAARRARGGLAGYGWALLLLVVGLVAIAALEPRATRSYLGMLGDLGPIGPAAFGVHVLALPAQSALLHVPATGACLDLVLGTPALTVCPWRLDPGTLGTALVPGPTPLSPWLWALSAIPPIAALLGGRRGALGTSGGAAIAFGAAAGLATATLAVVGAWFAAPRVDAAERVLLLPLSFEVDPLPAAALAIAWAVAGGAVGGWIEGRITVRRL